MDDHEKKKSKLIPRPVVSMGESFQDYYWIQDFEAKILNWADSNGFFYLISAYPKTIDHFKLEIVDIYRHSASFKI